MVTEEVLVRFINTKLGRSLQFIYLFILLYNEKEFPLAMVLISMVVALPYPGGDLFHLLGLVVE